MIISGLLLPLAELERSASWLGRNAMEQRIVGFHLDHEQHWVAELECGHDQHVRHDPPLTTREWVLTGDGRAEALGRALQCKKCDEGVLPVRST